MLFEDLGSVNPRHEIYMYSQDVITDDVVINDNGYMR